MAVQTNDAVNTSQVPESKKTNPIVRFLREVQVELKKTDWPSKDELTKFTAVVVITMLVVAVYLFVSDQVIGQITTRLFGA